MWFSLNYPLNNPGSIHEVDVNDEAFLLDHKVNGQELFPAAGHILMAWQTLCKNKGINFQQTPVTINQFKIHHGCIVPEQGKVYEGK